MIGIPRIAKGSGQDRQHIADNRYLGYNSHAKDETFFKTRFFAQARTLQDLQT